jgi:hypothetical protein
MTATDLIKTKEAFRLINKFGIIKPDALIGIHSGIDEQHKAASRIFPKAIFNFINKEQWDINNGQYDTRHDLLCFFNVFHYIPEPASAIMHVLRSCRYLLVQDLIIRDRGENIFGTDGDCMRYSFGMLKSNYPEALNMGLFWHKFEFFYPYIDDKKNVHFIALIKGIQNDFAD